jgi:hypothetical protein
MGDHMELLYFAWTEAAKVNPGRIAGEADSGLPNCTKKPFQGALLFWAELTKIHGK